MVQQRSIICGWNLIKNQLKINTELYRDSNILVCFKNIDCNKIDKIYLTASGFFAQCFKKQIQLFKNKRNFKTS